MSRDMSGGTVACVAVDIGPVSKILGHSSIAITADTYSHLLDGVGREAAERAAALVPRGPRGDPVRLQGSLRAPDQGWWTSRSHKNWRTCRSAADRTVPPVRLERTLRGFRAPPWARSAASAERTVSRSPSRTPVVIGCPSCVVRVPRRRGGQASPGPIAPLHKNPTRTDPTVQGPSPGSRSIRCQHPR
jgi:hypothetical protein